MKTAFDFTQENATEADPRAGGAEASSNRNPMTQAQKATLSRAWENRRYQIFLGISLAVLLLLFLYGSLVTFS